MLDVLPGVTVEGHPVRRLRVRLRHVELRRLREPVAIEVPLTRNEHVLLVGMRQRGGRLDDDRAVHAVRDVHQDRLGAAVVHEDARVVRLEAEGERLAGEDVDEVLVRRNTPCVEVDGVRDRTPVRQCDLDRLTLRTWITGPGAPPAHAHAAYLTPGAICTVMSFRMRCTLTTSPACNGGSAAS